MNDNSQDKRNAINIVMGENIGLLIITEVERFSLSHQVHSVGSKANEDEFHDEEVEASPDKDKVKISGEEND